MAFSYRLVFVDCVAYSNRLIQPLAARLTPVHSSEREQGLATLFVDLTGLSAEDAKLVEDLIIAGRAPNSKPILFLR